MNLVVAIFVALAILLGLVVLAEATVLGLTGLQLLALAVILLGIAAVAGSVRVP